MWRALIPQIMRFTNFSVKKKESETVVAKKKPRSKSKDKVKIKTLVVSKNIDEIQPFEVKLSSLNQPEKPIYRCLPDRTTM